MTTTYDSKIDKIVETDYFSTGTHSRSYHSYATHWMPLPNPPQTEKEIM